MYFLTDITNVSITMFIVYLVLALLAGGAIGFFVTKKIFQDELKKNPPINEKMIRAMYMQMGRKPSEAQIRQTINAMNQYSTRK